MEEIFDLIINGDLSDANKLFKEMMEDKILSISEGRKVVIKVNSKGQRRRKIVCGKGKKLKDGKCVIQTSSEKLAKKKGLKKAQRTKKAAGAGAQRRASKKRAKALKKRKSQGL